MLKSFTKRLKLEKILQGSIYALGGALLTAGIMVSIFQIFKLTDWYFNLIIAGGSLLMFAIILLIYCLIRKIKDKDVARRIDSNFKLHEKASTMVEFKDKDGFLIEKQREDAKKSIKFNNPRKLAIKFTMASLCLPALGTGALATSFFTNDIINILTVETEDPNFDDDTDKIIDDIKKYIGKSQASAAFKERLYKILEELRADLKGDTSIPSRTQKVNAAKAEVDVALDDVNTKEEIGEELSKGKTDFTRVGEVVLNAETEKLQEAFENMLSKINTIVSTDGLLKLFGEWIDTLEEFFKNINIPKSDANYNTFRDLLTKLNAIYDNVEDKIAASGNATTATINQLIINSQEQAKKAIEEAISNLKSDLTLEKANEELAEKVKKLMDQLIDPSSDQEEPIEGEGEGEKEGDKADIGDKGTQEIEADEGESGSADGGKGNGDGDSGEGSGSGDGGKEGEGDGQGKGEGASGGGAKTEYGSNDKVYTGEKGESEYSEVIGDYQNEASDDAKNTGDDDLEGAIGDYFDELYGDAKDKTNP